MTIFGSPALGDLDNDGDLEIVVGGFDKRLYAYHHHGALLAGFPADSYLAFRFPTWPNLRGALADGIWSSPALADLDGDGFLDILLGTDEGYFDARWGGNAYGWSCPYRLPAGWAPGYCGGSLYALNRFGQVLPGYPRYILETIQSTPAVVDMNLDGRLDVVVGTGAFYHTYSPDRPTHGFRIQAWDRTGNEVPGWSGGKALGGVAPASPGVGDIAGDSRPEIVLGANDGRLHAWHLNGSPVAGFPMRPRSRLGGGTGFDVGLGFILADYDGDGKMEIFVSQNDSITVIDGNGAQLTTSNNGADGRPGYATGGWLVNNPAVGDVNGDGRLDLVAHDSRLYVWTLPAAGSQADWPQFKRDASRASRFRTPGFLAAATDRSAVIKNIIDPTRGGAFGIRNGGDEPLNWSLDRSGAASNVTFSRLSGTISPGESTSVQISASGLNGFGSGFHHLGAVVVNTTTQSGAPAGSDSIELRLLKGNLTELFLPLTRR